jgi:hypothetical protein
VVGRLYCKEATSFYRLQLHRHAEAVAYLHHRGLRSPELIEHMRIGYAPGGCLRGWLIRLGYPLPVLRQAGLVSAVGYDTYMHRIVFPLEGNSQRAGTHAMEQRRTSGGKAGNSTFATPGDGAGSDTRNLRGVMPNSPPNSLDLLTRQHSFPGLASRANSALHRRGK